MNKESTRNARWPLAIGAVAILGWATYLVLALSTTSQSWMPEALRLPPLKENETVLSQRGQFGDAFGAFNALVSTLALVGLFYTLRSQQDQLAAQYRTSESNDLLVKQQQFQEQYYRAVDAYRELLVEVSVRATRGERDEAPFIGRAALHHLWREGIIAPLETCGVPLLEAAVRAQRQAHQNEHLGSWNTNAESARAIAALLQEVNEAPALQSACLAAIGRAWSTVYLANRFQLDALFRAWYTAYRVLNTAQKYQVDSDAINLYSAVFRAQLSWVEMALLLVNQTGLPTSESYPKAARFSNRFVMFDNLDAAHDVVVAILKETAMHRTAGVEESEIVLARAAFEGGYPGQQWRGPQPS